MCEIRKFSYDEMAEMLNRHELIVIDTNVWLYLFTYFSFNEIKELFSSMKKEYFIHEIFVVPHIFEEYINGKKKIKNTYNNPFKEKRKQLLDIYDDMNKRINKFDKSLYNCIGFQKIVDESNSFYINIKQNVDSLVIGDTKNFDNKEKLIDKFLETCNDNYRKIQLINASIPFEENIWKSDQKKSGNSDGDLKIWNEILELVVNYDCKKIVIIENEKKGEWNNPKVIDSLNKNSSSTLEIIDFKTFVRQNLPSISYSLFCKCVNNYERYHNYINITNFSELRKNYSELMNDFVPMANVDILEEARFLIEYDVKNLNLESSIKKISIHIDDVEQLNGDTPVITTEYDEVKLNHTFKQRLKCTIIINDNEKTEFSFDQIFVEYNVVSDRVLTKNSKFKEEWIDKSISYDFDELKRNLFAFK